MSRRLAREAAFKALFQLDFNSAEDEEREVRERLAIDLAIETIDETMLDEEPILKKKDLSYLESTVKGTRSRLAEIDELIISRLKESWQLSRIMAVDRNILRLAIYEMKFAGTPIPKNIVINEAIELAKNYGTDDSRKFVNGILEAISK